MTADAVSAVANAAAADDRSDAFGADHFTIASAAGSDAPAAVAVTATSAAGSDTVFM